MNAKLEEFRNRLRGPEEAKTIWQKFRIGSPTAWLALCLSSVTAFSSFIYYSDQLSVVVVPGVIFISRESDRMLRASVPGGITFINSGSRPIAVLKTTLVIAQPTDNDANLNCYHTERTVIELPMGPTIVKPYDVLLLKEVKFPSNVDGLPAERIPMTDINSRSTSGRIVLYCLEFNIVATDITWDKMIAVERVTLYPEKVVIEDIGAYQPVRLIGRNWFMREVGGGQWPADFSKSVWQTNTLNGQGMIDYYVEKAVGKASDSIVEKPKAGTNRH
jgi:hypothetical protein